MVYIQVYSSPWRAALVDDVEEAASSATPVGIDPTGASLLGLFSSSSVTPSSFVMPTTGASPFLTNSYRPMKEIVNSCLYIV
jgi:hypothetical protein